MPKFYKGFDKDLKCRGFQFALGCSYEHEGVTELCASGFHASETINDVWKYYPPKEARICEVELEAVVYGEDKVVGRKITILRELSAQEIQQEKDKMPLHRTMENLIRHMSSYFWTEMQWESWRSEFLSSEDFNNSSLNNAASIARFMESCIEQWPELKELMNGKGR